MTSRARRLVVSILSGIFGRGVALLAPMVVMGPMHQHLGPELFGMWLTTVALAAMASFLDFGIGNAALTRLSDAFGREDEAVVRRILGEAYALLATISAAFTLVVLIGVALAQLFAPQAVASGQVAVIGIVLVALFLSFPAGLIGRLLQARHAFIQSQLAQVAGPLLALVACLWGIRTGASPVAVIALYNLSNTLALLLWTLAHFLLTPSHRPTFRGLDWRSARGLLALGSEFFLLSIFSLSGMNADNVVIGARLGPETVAEYGVPAKLGSIPMLIVGTVFMPLWPLFGDALARRDRAWLLATTRRMSLLGAAGVLAIGLGLTVFADPIMTAWMGRPFADQQLILLGWTLAATVIAVTAPYNMVLNAAGQARPQILPWVAFAGISIGVKAFLLTAENSWLAPWITAISYALLITKKMITIGNAQIEKHC